MDSDKVKKVCAAYHEGLLRVGSHATPKVAQRLPDDAATIYCCDVPYDARIGHFLFMTEEIPRLLDAGRTEKAMRWLGWLQGALWGQNFETLHEAKLRNAPEGAEYKGDA